MKLIAFGVINGILSALLELAGGIGGAVDAMAGMVGKTTGIQRSVRDFKDGLHRATAQEMGVGHLTFTPVTPVGTAGTAATALPAPGAPMPAVAALPAPAAPAAGSGASSGAPGAPVVVNVQVDGQTVARAVHKAGSDTAARSFSPVPAY